jgi:LL-diaminopimelate aminotransferase
MVKLNRHFSKLPGGYLFQEIEDRTAAYREQHPAAKLLNLGIGDVSHPLPPAILKALSQASEELGDPKLFRGYGPSQGYPFLREAIALHDYPGLGIEPDEIFVSNGAQNDIGNIQEIFDIENRIAVADPTYPGYLESNIMAGRTKARLKSGHYGGVLYLPCTEENGFKPEPPSQSADILYICSPNNPTGVAMDRPLLKRWVDYARKNKAVIIFDGAYEAYITDPDIPKSLYEIEGAKEVAIEIRSFSKTAGFTGLRCSYTVVPRQLSLFDLGAKRSLWDLWKRRHDSKFGGVPYPIQRAAAAVYTPEGQKEIRRIVQTYMEGARLLREGLKSLGVAVYGGVNSPYVWFKAPQNDSWKCFDMLLTKAEIIAVPGAGFGRQGEGFMRLSAFAPKEVIEEALLRLRSVLCAPL